MANTEIDSLSLDIQITGLDEEKLKNLTTLSKAVSRLSKSLENADFSKLKDIKVPKGLSSIQLITQNFKDSAISSDVGSFVDGFDKIGDSIQETAQKVENGALIIESGTEKLNTVTPGLKKALDEAKKVIDGKSKKSFFEIFNNKLTKTLKRIKTIAFIKLVRSAINAVVQSIQKGINNLALFDSRFNDTMSRLKTDTTIISNSLGAISRPLLETIEPLITQFSMAMAEISNRINEITASMRGLTKYTKINTDYMEDYAKATEKAKLFSFDTFNTLDISNKNPMFEEVEINENRIEQNQKLVKLIEQIKGFVDNIVNAIKIVVKYVGEIISSLEPFITELFKTVNFILEKVLPFVDDLLGALMPIVDIIFNDILTPLLEVVNAVLKPVLSLLDPIMSIVKGIVDLIVSTFKPAMDMIGEIVSTIAKVLDPLLTLIIEPLSSILDGAIKTAIEVIKELVDSIWNVCKLLYDNTLKPMVDFINGNLIPSTGNVESMVTTIKEAIKQTYNILKDILTLNFGGLAKDLSEIAGNSVYIDYSDNPAVIPGTESFLPKIQKSISTSKTSLGRSLSNEYDESYAINPAVITQSIINAIFDSGLIEAVRESGIISIDGRDIAQSKNFKAELNRTNPGLNIR